MGRDLQPSIPHNHGEADGRFVHLAGLARLASTCRKYSTASLLLQFLVLLLAFSGGYPLVGVYRKSDEGCEPKDLADTQ